MHPRDLIEMTLILESEDREQRFKDILERVSAKAIASRPTNVLELFVLMNGAKESEDLIEVMVLMLRIQALSESNAGKPVNE